MASTYQKPFKTFDDQLALLEQRGLVVEDRAEGISILRAVGYYTLGGYLYPMRKILPGTNPVHRLDQFLPGASMTLVASLYRFDRELRLLCLDALERIERAIKVAVAYQLGRHDKFAHDNGVLHDIKHLRAAPGARHSAHKEWNDAHKGKVRRRRHDSIQTFESKYGFPLPIWVAIDAMDFGDISKLVAHLKGGVKNSLAREFAISRGSDFASWVRSMCLVRNIAAHHDRLWNRELADVPTQPKGPEARFFDEVRSEQHWWSRTYMALIVIAYFMTTVDPSSDWGPRMGAHLQTLPVGCGISYRALGAPPTWSENPLWRCG